MEKEATTSDPLNCQKYGVPIYGASWIPLDVIRSADAAGEKSGDGEGSSSSASPNLLVLSGGGGEGRSGIPNAVLVAEFDFADNSLSDQPVVKLETGAKLPYRMAVHPRGEGLICSLPEDCRWFEWDIPSSSENGKLGLKLSDKVLTQLEDVGQQLALAFSEDGSVLAVGGEDGKLRVLRWPSLEILFNEEDANNSVRDLHFSLDGKYLVSVRDRGPGAVWDVAGSRVAASLPREKDEVFGYCRFSQSSDGDQVLYTTCKGGSIVLWNTSSWRRIASKQIVRDSVSAFSVSVDGKLLAIGTTQGDILILNSSKMRVQMIVRRAHLGIVTTLTFSSDSRALASASMDSSVRVTLVEDNKISNGSNYWIIVFIIVLAILVYFLMSKGKIPEGWPF